MSKPKVISLYTGAGGLDLGLEAAGFDVAVALEMDPEAVATIRKNRDWNILCENIHEVTTKKLLAEGGLRVGEADLLCGGPPCQPFSKSGYWHSGEAKRLDDPRARTLDAYLRVLREAQPKAFLLENVPGLAFSQKSEGLELLRTTIADINQAVGTNYQVRAVQLNAANFGIPQTRERVFVIGQREGALLDVPKPTHSLPPRIDMASGGIKMARPNDGLIEPCTAWDAIGHLEDDDNPELKVRGKWADLLPSIPEGHNYLFHTDRGAGLALFGWRRRYWSMLLKLAKDRPSWTLTAQPGPAIGPFHWKNRRLSSAELCGLQTFPAGYEVVGNVQSAHRQIGNAVPSALVELLGVEIRRQLLGGRPRRRSPRLLPQTASKTPAPDRPRTVTQQKYLDLVGSHEAHPGTGRGPGAQRRQEASAS